MAFRYAELLFQFCGAFILGRLVTAEEFGVAAIGSGISFILHSLRTLGMSAYIVSELDLTPARLRTAVTVLWMSTAALVTILVIASYPLAGFYADTRVKDVILLAALLHLLGTIGLPASAILHRRMAFRLIATLALASAAANSVATVLVAYFGWGHMAPVAGLCVGALLQAVVLTLLHPELLFLRPSLAEARGILRFGALVSSTTILTNTGTQSPSLILGRLAGMSDTGFYARAGSLTNIFKFGVQSVFDQVILPVFSQRLRAKENLRHTYIKGSQVCTGLAWPFYVVSIILAAPLMHHAYGPGWEAAVPASRLLAVAQIFYTAVLFSNPALVATGHVAANLRRESVIQAARILLVLVAATHGFNMVAGAEIVAMLVTAVVNNMQIKVSLNLAWRDLLIPNLISARVAALSAVVPLAGNLLFGAALMRSPLALVALLIPTGAAWFGSLALTGHPLWPELLALARSRAGSPAGGGGQS